MLTFFFILLYISSYKTIQTLFLDAKYIAVHPLLSTEYHLVYRIIWGEGIVFSCWQPNID